MQARLDLEATIRKGQIFAKGVDRLTLRMPAPASMRGQYQRLVMAGRRMRFRIPNAIDKRNHKNILRHYA
jgi:hypothetical protein